MAALVIAEHEQGQLKSSMLNTVTAAKAAAGEVHLLVIGHQLAEVVASAAKVSGVTKVLVVDDAAFTHVLPENIAAQIISVAGQYTHIAAPATANGKGFMPRVAAKLDVAQISEITKVISSDTFERTIYAGNVIATVQSLDAIKVLTVRTTAFEAATLDGAAEIDAIAAVPATTKATFIGRELAKSERPELASAKIVVSGGRGVGSAENFAILEALADKLNAAMGASRAAVDAGFVPNDWQVGQTGKIVAPQLYIAIGISGAIQHLAGMKDSKVIVAINKDEEAPIFSVADYGIVGDLFEVVPDLVKQLG